MKRRPGDPDPMAAAEPWRRPPLRPRPRWAMGLAIALALWIAGLLAMIAGR